MTDKITQATNKITAQNLANGQMRKRLIKYVPLFGHDMALNAPCGSANTLTHSAFGQKEKEEGSHLFHILWQSCRHHETGGLIKHITDMGFEQMAFVAKKANDPCPFSRKAQGKMACRRRLITSCSGRCPKQLQGTCADKADSD